MPSRLMERLASTSRPLIIAHRGASLLSPENTLPAIALGIQQGADLVEVDCRLAADQVLVVIHDRTLDRTTNARTVFGAAEIPVASKSTTELKQLDAGTWFSPAFAGVRLPTLAEALQAFPDDAFPLIERKTGSARILVDTLREHNRLTSAVVQSFDRKFLAQCRRLAPELPLVTLADALPSNSVLQSLADAGFPLIACKQEILSPDILARLRARGLLVWAWTVDEVDRARELVRLGVRGIITNDPPMMIAALT